MQPAQTDPRGPRSAAVLTTLVLAAALITGSRLLLAVQAAVFAAGALGGHRYAPYGLLYRALVRPRLGPPAELEDARPPRFAQGVGPAFTLLAVLAAPAGLGPLATALTAPALGAASLNAAFDYCLGCEFHLLLHRARARPPEGAGVTDRARSGDHRGETPVAAAACRDFAALPPRPGYHRTGRMARGK